MLQVNFIMIYIIHKISVLLKINKILKRCLMNIYYFLKKSIFFDNIFMQSTKHEEYENITENVIKNVRNFIRLKNKQMMAQLKV